MAYDSVPIQFPEKGFYYHYKHDPNGPINKYAYEVVGYGHYTEDDLSPERCFQVEYRPLYDSAFVYQNGKIHDHRPVEMFFETIEKEGKTFQRFTKISDTAVIAELTKIRDEMYAD